MLDIRMDPRLRARVDASDVLQETWIEAIERVDSYAAKPSVPFLVWLRFLAAQKLVTLRRRHLGAKRRDVRRQVSLFRRAEFPEASSAVLVRDLAQQVSTPSQGAMRAETQRRLLEAVEGMRPADREVPALRHFEELTTAEAAAELGMTEEATRKRYLRALHRLRTVLDRDADAPNP
jgi:RNA polymerase sigma-70 factor (ECF subfamily)